MKKATEADSQTPGEQKGFRTYLKDIGIYGVVQQLLGLRGLIFVPLVTKTLGVSSYGLLSLASVTSGFLIWFVLLSFTSGVIYKLPGDDRPGIVVRSYFSLMTVIVIAWTMLLIVMFPLSGYFAEILLKDADSKIIFQIVLFGLLPDAISGLLFTYFRVRNETARYLRYQVLSLGAEFIVIVSAVLLGAGIAQVLAAGVLVRVVVTVVLLAVLVKNEGVALPEWRIIKPYLIFCVPLIGTNLGSWVIELSDRYFLAYFRSPTAVGIYSASYSLPRPILDISNSIWFVLAPVLAGFWNRGDKEQFRRYLRNAVKLVSVFALPAGVAVATLSVPLLTILATPEVGKGSAFVTPFIAAAYILQVYVSYLACVFMFSGRTQVYAGIALAAAVINLAGNILLVPSFGILGAAVATLVTYTVSSAVSLYLAHKVIRLPIDWSFIVRIGIASATMGATFVALRPGPDLGLLFAVAAGLAVFIVTALILKVPDREDRQRIREALFGSRKQGQD